MNPTLAPKRIVAPHRWWDASSGLLPGTCLILVLATLFYLPALVWGKTLAHGDISTIDAPLLDFFARVVKGRASAIWSNQVYGGHPIFAEGQGGFAHPLNIMWATIVTPIVGPIYSMNLFYWLLKILGGIGMIGLCRCLGASSWASTFAALAAIFSSIWIWEQYVLPVFHTLTWIPWGLWAMEHWLKRPTPQSAVLFGGAWALVCLSGYPQGLHGAIIYALATLFIVPFQAELRREWARSWRRRATLALVACAGGVGLASVQLLPLFELVGLSHRSAGVGIDFGGTTPLSSYLRGFLITGYTSKASYYPGTGSLLVCILASTALLLPVPARVKGHVLAGLVLLLLGMERATPVFRFVYDHHLLPGLSYFRQMQVYLSLAAMGIAVLAAFAIDGLAQWGAQSRDAPSSARLKTDRAKIVGYLVLAGFWIWAVSSLGSNRILALNLGIVSVGGAAMMGLIRIRRLDLFAPVLAIVLAGEIVALRLHPFNFFDRTIFERPPAIAAIQAVPDWREFKTMTVSLAGTAGLSPPRQPDLANRITKLVAAISPMTNLLWDLPSLNGHFALPLSRRMAVDRLLQDEIFGVVATPPGLRLIDLLSIRFITNGGELTTAGFRTLYVDSRNEMQTLENKEHWTQENTAAFPRFQFYTYHQTVDSLEAAISAIKNLKRRALVIENPDHVPGIGAFDAVDDGSASEAPSARLEVLKATDTQYRFRVSAPKSTWLFLADAYYPGWTATIDGKESPVFSAQILGKAVPIPPGTHDVTFRFRSMPFYWGLCISVITVALLTLVCWRSRRRPDMQ